MRYIAETNIGFRDWYYILGFGYGFKNPDYNPNDTNSKELKNIYNIQHVAPVTDSYLIRAGLLYSKPGVALDYLPNNKTKLSAELFDVESASLAFYIRYYLRKNIDISAGIMKSEDSKIGYKNYLFGLTYNL